MGGEKRPGIDCLRMCSHSQKNLGICLYSEIVDKINTYISDTFPYHQKIVTCSCLLPVRITFNSKKVEAICRMYEGEVAFLWLPISFGKSIRYEVLSFGSINKAS